MAVIVRANESLIRAGVGIRITTNTPLPSAIRGKGGYVGRATWGPLNQRVETLSRGQIADTYGTPGAASNTFDGAEEMYNGGAIGVTTVRVGTGGTQGSANLLDGAAATVGVLQAKFPGSLAHQYQIRAAADGSANKELLIYRAGALLETFRFSTVGVQIDNLVAAVGNAAGTSVSKSNLVFVNKTVNGDSTVANIAQTNLPVGTDPTIDSTAYANALTTLANGNWYVGAFDTEDTTLHATIKQWVDTTLLMHGKLRKVFLGLPTSVGWNTATVGRKAQALTHNDPAITLVGNGFQVYAADGNTVLNREGFRAAARWAGAHAACRPNQQLTHRVIPDAIGLVNATGELTDDQLVEAKQAGVAVFGFSRAGRVQMEEGVNTFTNPAIPPVWAESMSLAWRKDRRVMTRFYLMDDVTSAWDAMIETSNNTPAGRDALKSEAQSVVNKYIAQGALISGTVIIDDTRQATADADEAFFAFDDLVDADGAERIILNAIFP